MVGSRSRKTSSQGSHPSLLPPSRALAQYHPIQLSGCLYLLGLPPIQGPLLGLSFFLSQKTSRGPRAQWLAPRLPHRGYVVQ